MKIRRQTAAWSCAALTLLAPGLAAAQAGPKCPPAPKLESSSVSLDTKAAVDVVNKLLGKVGLDVNFKTTRDSVLKDNPRADQMVIVLTMANTFCEMIASDTSLSGNEKAARLAALMQDMLSRALGPAPVARTDAPKQSRLDRTENPAALAAARPMFKFVAQGYTGSELPLISPPRTGFLREAPFYVNDYNKYFVIVGAAASREEAVKLMNKLKAKAPQHDFVVYAPYGSNTNYGVMMASWAPRDVATEALRQARKDVAADAFLWSCRGSGESC